MNLTTQLHLVLGLGMSGAAPLLVPCAFVARVGTALPLLACFTLCPIGDKRRVVVLALLTARLHLAVCW